MSVHDVYHFRTTLPLHEGRVVVRWLDGRGVPFFTPSRAKARANFDALNRCGPSWGWAGPRRRGQPDDLLHDAVHLITGSSRAA